MIFFVMEEWNITNGLIACPCRGSQIEHYISKPVCSTKLQLVVYL